MTDESPSAPIPVTPMPGFADRTDRPAGDDHVRADEMVDELPVAQGQEMLGPCRECAGYWTRIVKRGQKPQTCPLCKRDGPPDQ